MNSRWARRVVTPPEPALMTWSGSRPAGGRGSTGIFFPLTVRHHTTGRPQALQGTRVMPSPAQLVQSPTRFQEQLGEQRSSLLQPQT
jgi:hypothetical protein